MASVMHPSSQEENLEYENHRTAPLLKDLSAEALYRSNVDCKQALRRLKKTRRYNFISDGPLHCDVDPEEEEERVQMALQNVCLNTGPLPFDKNSKKSRNGIKNKPKKNGMGGRARLGKLGAELAMMLNDSLVLDCHDPNYDSEQDEAIKLERSEPKFTKASFEERVKTYLKEFYEHGQIEEIITALKEVNLNAEFRVLLPYLALNMAIDRHSQHCEMTSRLLASASGNVLSSDEVRLGFDQVLEELSDLTLDAPSAPEILGRFIARAVADDLLPPKYVQSYKGKLTCPFAVRAMAEAENLLLIKHSYTRLDHVWGVGGAHHPNKLLLKRVKLLLQEYISSNDMNEATRCVRELDAPHFHHELVYQALLMVLEQSSAEVCSRIGKLLTYWSNAVIVTVDQMTKGIKRIYDDLDDIRLDVPNAAALLERFLVLNRKIVPRALLRSMADKSRKRFVSEGDALLFKFKEDDPFSH